MLQKFNDSPLCRRQSMPSPYKNLPDFIYSLLPQLQRVQTQAKNEFLWLFGCIRMKAILF